MALLQKLNAAAYTYKTLGELEIGESYIIEQMIKGKSEYGPTVLVKLLSKTGEKITSYLPKRFSETISEQEASDYKSGSMVLIYEGKIRNSYKITFRELE